MAIGIHPQPWLGEADYLPVGLWDSARESGRWMCQISMIAIRLQEADPPQRDLERPNPPACNACMVADFLMRQEKGRFEGEVDASSKECLMHCVLLLPIRPYLLCTCHSWLRLVLRLQLSLSNARGSKRLFSHAADTSGKP